MKTILVPVDLTPTTEKIIDVAARFTRDWHAKLVLIHVIPELPAGREGVRIPQHERDDTAHILREKHRKLQEFASHLASSGCETDALLVEGRTIVEKLLSEASRMNADILVMGSGGHGTLHDVLVGSTCRKILRMSHTPVLVIPIGAKGDSDSIEIARNRSGDVVQN